MVHKKIMCFNNYLLASIVFAVGTFIQTSLHIYLVLCGYYVKICRISPKGAIEIFFYLTYFYNSSCGPLKLELSSKANHFLSPFVLLNQTLLENIVEEILNKAVLPETANSLPKLSIYLYFFILFDVVWAISAIALLMGVCFRIKGTCTLVFYGAWIISTLFVSIVDIVATVHFSFDIFETLTLTGWMKFVGIKNIDDLRDLDIEDGFLSMTPTLAVLSFTTKFIILWIFNVVGIYCVIQSTILAYQQSYEQEQKKNYRKQRGEIRNNINLETAAARIHNWQLFYGAIEANTNNNDSKSSSSLSSSSSSSSPPSSSSMLSSGNKELNSYPQQTEESQICSDLPLTPPTPTYYCYPTVDSVINSQTTTSSNDYMDELRSQKPWSYVQSYNHVLKLKFQQNIVDETDIETETKF